MYNNFIFYSIQKLKFSSDGPGFIGENDEKLTTRNGLENTRNIITKASELITVQTAVNKLLMEEGGRENATVETRNMSETVNKTLELTCKWVRHILIFRERIFHYLAVYYYRLLKMSWLMVAKKTAHLLENF